MLALLAQVDETSGAYRFGQWTARLLCLGIVVAVAVELVRRARRPATPGGSAWHPDPAGQHQLRWWDGAWTEHVMDDGRLSQDPIPPPPPS